MSIKAKEREAHDAVGNRLTSAGPTSYNYNASNELTSSSVAIYAYDNNGNTTSRTTSAGTTSYTWDFENRLTSVVLPGAGGTVYFRYDPFGRRIYKSSPAGTNVYVYDGNNVIQELGGSGNPLASYTHGPGVDEPLVMYRGLTAAYFHADGLGSITSLTGGTGQLAASYVYDSFGKLTASTGTVTNPFQYAGREFDSETGLYYYRARHYDPTVGRFLNEDPIGFGGAINFYSYVENSPSNRIDPSGLWSTEAHSQMIRRALGPCGVSDADISEIQQGSQSADSLMYQAPQYAFMHAMSNGVTHQSPLAAAAQTSSFIAAEMQVATNQMGAGARSQAMFTFGVAMHPLMDVTSPAHTDPDGNPIPWCGFSPFSCSNLSQHDDMPWTSIENLDYLNAHPELQEVENSIIRNWFQALTGQKLKCCSH